MAGNKSIEDKTRKIYNQRIEPGKEFQQMQSAQNQLLQIQAARQQNLREGQIESENLAQQNQLLAQAAQVGMMSQGAGQMQVNPATQGVMGRYGLSRPMTSTTTKQSQQSTVAKQNITIHNNTTNITNNTNTVPANIGGPIQGRPIQFQQGGAGGAASGNDSGGMAKFKNWINKTFEKQEETRRQRDREYQRREISLTKSANKMMRKLEDFSKDLTRKLDPRNVGKTIGGQLKTLTRILGLGALVTFFPKILDWINNAQKKVQNVYIPKIKEFVSWIKGGENGAQEPEFITKLKSSITDLFIGKNAKDGIRTAFSQEGFFGGLRVLFDEQMDKLRDTLQKNWEYATKVPKPKNLDVLEVGRYLVGLVSTLFTGKNGYNDALTSSIKNDVNNRRNEWYLNQGGKQLVSEHNKKVNASLGLHAYATGQAKYLAPEYLDKTGKNLAIDFVPMIDENGDLVTDGDGNVKTQQRTRRSSSLAQGTEFTNLINNARRGMADPTMTASALSRIGEAIKADGELIMFWDDITSLIGTDKANEWFGNKKIEFRAIWRSKTIGELAAERKAESDEDLRKILNSIATKKLKIRSAVRLWGAFKGGARGTLAGATTLNPFVTLQGGQLGAMAGWASAWYDNNTTVQTFVAVCKKEKIDLHTIDYIPIGNSEKDALDTAKLLYGNDTRWEGNIREFVVTVTADEWAKILKELFGENIENAKFGLELDNLETNRIIEDGLKALSTTGSGVQQSSFYDYDFEVDESKMLYHGADPNTRGTFANAKHHQEGDIIKLGEFQDQQAREEAERQQKNASWSLSGLGYGGGSRGPTDASPVGSGVILPEDHPMRQQMEQQKEAEQKGSDAAGPNGENAEETGTAEYSDQSNGEFIYGASGAFDPQAAAEWAENNVWTGGKSKGIASGLCSDFVGMALRNGGADVTSAGTVGNLEKDLQRSGWVNTGLTKNFEDSDKYQTGDVAIIYENGSPAHASIFTGSRWVSDVPHTKDNGGWSGSRVPRIYRYKGTGQGSGTPGAEWKRRPNVNHVRYAVERWYAMAKGGHVDWLFAGTNGKSYDRVPGDRQAVEAVMANPNHTIEDFVRAAYTPTEKYKDTPYQADAVLQLMRGSGNGYSGAVGGGGTYTPNAAETSYSGNNFLEFLDTSKEFIKNAAGKLTHQVRYLADGTKQIYVKAGEAGMRWENAYSGGLANYEHGVRKRSSAEQAIYDRYSGRSQVAYPTQMIHGKNRNEWWAEYFDEKGNLKTKDTKDINPELKKSLQAIEIELKKGNGMDELQLKLAAESLDNTMMANAGNTAKEQRMINALVAKNQGTGKAGMSTIGAERGINKKS